MRFQENKEDISIKNMLFINDLIESQNDQSDFECSSLALLGISSKKIKVISDILIYCNLGIDYNNLIEGLELDETEVMLIFSYFKNIIKRNTTIIINNKEAEEKPFINLDYGVNSLQKIYDAVFNRGSKSRYKRIKWSSENIYISVFNNNISINEQGENQKTNKFKYDQYYNVLLMKNKTQKALNKKKSNNEEPGDDLYDYENSENEMDDYEEDEEDEEEFDEKNEFSINVDNKEEDFSHSESKKYVYQRNVVLLSKINSYREKSNINKSNNLNLCKKVSENAVSISFKIPICINEKRNEDLEIPHKFWYKMGYESNIDSKYLNGFQNSNLINLGESKISNKKTRKTNKRNSISTRCRHSMAKFRQIRKKSTIKFNWAQSRQFFFDRDITFKIACGELEIMKKMANLEKINKLKYDYINDTFWNSNIKNIHAQKSSLWNNSRFFLSNKSWRDTQGVYNWNRCSNCDTMFQSNNTNLGSWNGFLCGNCTFEDVPSLDVINTCFFCSKTLSLGSIFFNVVDDRGLNYFSNEIWKSLKQQDMKKYGRIKLSPISETNYKLNRNSLLGEEEVIEEKLQDIAVPDDEKYQHPCHIMIMPNSYNGKKNMFITCRRCFQKNNISNVIDNSQYFDFQQTKVACFDKNFCNFLIGKT